MFVLSKKQCLIKHLKIKTMTAIYHNRQTKETYKLSGVKDLAHAWRLSNFVCNQKNWNESMFCEDVKVTIQK